MFSVLAIFVVLGINALFGSTPTEPEANADE